jgi:hypothetical protein
MEIKEREKNQKGITMHDEKNVLESAIGERDRIAPENSVVLNP